MGMPTATGTLAGGSSSTANSNASLSNTAGNVNNGTAAVQSTSADAALVNLLQVPPSWRDPAPNGRYAWNPENVVQEGQYNLVSTVVDKQFPPGGRTVYHVGQRARLDNKEYVIGALGWSVGQPAGRRTWGAVLVSHPDHKETILATLPNLVLEQATADSGELKEVKEIMEHTNIEALRLPKRAKLHPNNESTTATGDPLPPRQPLAPVRYWEAPPSSRHHSRQSHKRKYDLVPERHLCVLKRWCLRVGY